MLNKIALTILFLLVYANISTAEIVITNTNIEGHSLNEWCNAIGKAENSVTHPYGIMAHYKHTTPLEACRNTVLHKYNDYKRLKATKGLKTPFIDYLADRYAPIGAKNDPRGLNRYWKSNVAAGLKKGTL